MVYRFPKVKRKNFGLQAMLEHFFKPSSVAVVGASKDPKKIGHDIDRQWKAEDRSLLSEAKPRTRTIFSVALIAGSIALLLVGLVFPSSLGYTFRFIPLGLVTGLLCLLIRK